jgi:hypothetical protein
MLFAFVMIVMLGSFAAGFLVAGRPSCTHETTHLPKGYRPELDQRIINRAIVLTREHQMT